MKLAFKYEDASESTQDQENKNVPACHGAIQEVETSYRMLRNGFVGFCSEMLLFNGSLNVFLVVVVAHCRKRQQISQQLHRADWCVKHHGGNAN